MECFGMPASLGFREAKILPHSQNPENMAIVPHAKHNFGGYIPLGPIQIFIENNPSNI